MNSRKSKGLWISTFSGISTVLNVDISVGRCDEISSVTHPIRVLSQGQDIERLLELHAVVDGMEKSSQSVSRIVFQVAAPKTCRRDLPPPSQTHLISSIPMMVYDIPIVAGSVHRGPQAAYMANGIMLDQTKSNLDA
jgi:hypothetical protein